MVHDAGSQLFHNLNVHFLHIHLLIELRREFGLPQQLRVHSGRHVGEDKEFGTMSLPQYWLQNNISVADQIYAKSSKHAAICLIGTTNPH